MEKVHRRVSLPLAKTRSSTPVPSSRMKYNRALEYVLENAPVRAKDPEKKVRSHALKARRRCQKRIDDRLEKSRTHGSVDDDEDQNQRDSSRCQFDTGATARHIDEVRLQRFRESERLLERFPIDMAREGN